MQELVITIQKVSNSGHGLYRDNNCQLIILGAVVGDKCKVIYDPLNKDWQTIYDFEILEQSKHRVDALCKLHGFGENKCHGCPWMEIEYSKQLELKKLKLVHAFERIGRFNFAKKIEKIHPAIILQGFRDRVQLKTNGELLGFVGQNKKIIDIKECPAMKPKLQNLLTLLRNQLPNPDWRPDEKHQWSFIDLDDQMQFNEVSINIKRAFSQAMSSQNLVMKNWLKNKIQNIHVNYCLELFAGAGNFTEVLLGEKLNVTAIEFQKASLENLLKLNSTLKVIELNLYARASVEKFFRDCKKENVTFDTLVANPAQAGIKFAKHWVNQFNIQHAFYISCSVESFVRDSVHLQKAGMDLIEIELVDQFPHTPHVEILSYWSKK